MIKNRKYLNMNLKSCIQRILSGNEMKTIIILSIVFIIPFLSCKSIKRIEINKANSIRINIIDVKRGSVEEPWDLDVEFEVINETDKDYFIPIPSDIYNNSFVTEPHFFSYELKGYDCEFEVLFSDGKVKKLDGFMKIEGKSKKIISMKPFNSLSVYCSAIENEQKYLKVVYMPDQKQISEEFVKNNYKDESELSTMLGVYKQIYADTIISLPFNLSFD